MREILLVENDASDTAMMRAVLKRIPELRVTAVTDGRAALAHLNEALRPRSSLSLPDLILLDLYMTPMDGLAFLHELRGDLRIKHLLVVVVTGSEKSQDVLSAYRAGANACLSKPFDVPAVRGMAHAIDQVWLGEVLRPALPEVEG